MANWEPSPDDELPPTLAWLKRLHDQANTPEAREARRRQQNEELNQGDFIYETYPRFQLSRICAKCGYDAEAQQPHGTPPHSYYVPEGPAPVVSGRHDVIARRCPRCSFTWFERPVDAEEQNARTGTVPAHELTWLLGSIYIDVYGKEDPGDPVMPPSEVVNRLVKRLREWGHHIPEGAR